MNLLQIPLDIQLVSTCQSLSVAYTAQFSQRKDKQFPSHTTIFSSKKYQTSLQPTSLRRAWEPEHSQHVPNGIRYSVQSISVISSDAHIHVCWHGRTVLIRDIHYSLWVCVVVSSPPIREDQPFLFRLFFEFREGRFLRKIRLMPVEEDRSSWVGLWTFRKVWSWLFHVRFLEKFLGKCRKRTGRFFAENSWERASAFFRQ